MVNQAFRIKIAYWSEKEEEEEEEREENTRYRIGRYPMGPTMNMGRCPPSELY